MLSCSVVLDHASVRADWECPAMLERRADDLTQAPYYIKSEKWWCPVVLNWTAMRTVQRVNFADLFCNLKHLYVKIH